MIQQADVDATLRAWNPATTDEEIAQTYQEMMSDWQNLYDRLAHQLRQEWTAHHGRQPDGLSWGQIQNKARYDAEVQIRAEYLDPITQEIVARQADEVDPVEEWDLDQMRAALRDPEKWKTGIPTPSWRGPDPQELEAKEIVDWVWPDATTDFYFLAVEYIWHRMFTNQDYPAEPEGELFETTTEMIRAVEKEAPTYAPYSPDHEERRRAFINSLPG